MQEELNVREPNNMFYMVSVEIEMENEKGGTKKMKEHHLVDAVSPSDVETKVAHVMDGTMFEWRITNMSISKINIVY